MRACECIHFRCIHHTTPMPFIKSADEIFSISTYHTFSVFVTHSLSLCHSLSVVYYWCYSFLCWPKNFHFPSSVHRLCFFLPCIGFALFYCSTKMVSGAHSIHWLLWIFFLGFIVILSPEQWNECVCVCLFNFFILWIERTIDELPCTHKSTKANNHILKTKKPRMDIKYSLYLTRYTWIFCKECSQAYELDIYFPFP